MPAEGIEYPQREIVNSINFAGLAPSNGNLQQLWQTMQRNPWLTHAAVDSGTASAMAATLSPAPSNLFFGMVVRIKVAFSCVGPSTLNLNGLGAYPITRANGAACAAGDYLAGEILNLDFDGSSWQIENWNGPPGVSSTVNNYTLGIPYSVAGGTANALTGTFTPPITAVKAGDPFLIKATVANSGAATLQVDALATHPLIWPDGTVLIARDIRPGAILWIVYDGTSYQILSVRNPDFAIGFGGSTGYFNVPESTFVRIPGTTNFKNTLGTSTYANGVFTAGAGETGWWIFSFTAQYIPSAGGVMEGSCWVVRLTGPNVYCSQQNVNDPGNQGNAAACTSAMFLDVAGQAVFDVYHLLGSGVCAGEVNGVRLGR